MNSSESAQTSAPRYMALAEILRSGIAAGSPGVGEQLPTEHELCDTHDMSRHTVREALRLLSEDGLIARRRGAGTVVIARESQRRYAQHLGGVDDLMQYGPDVHLTPLQESIGTLDRAVARALGVTVTGEFHYVGGVRGREGQPPIALTDMYIRTELSPGAEDWIKLNGAVTDWIARERGVATERIEQSIHAGTLTETEAEALDAEAGEPALRLRRRYYDKGGRVIALSDTVHPADRFSYDMALMSEVAD